MYTIWTYNAGETTWTIADFLNCVQIKNMNIFESFPE